MMSVRQPGVSALLLRIGESTAAKAYESLQRQTVPFHEIVVMENVSPFREAFNRGVAEIDTTFFVQCDADMELDENCVEVLLSKMTAQTGMVVGYLRDPLQGTVRGVKLYRTECCRLYPLQDSSNCEEIFRVQLLENHWLVTITDRNSTLGSHAPDPNDKLYQFERFKLMGAKIRSRRAWDDLAYRLIQLARSESRDIVPLAVSAMICGYHRTYKEDHLNGFPASPEYHLWIERSARLHEGNVCTTGRSRELINAFVGYWHGLEGRRGSGVQQMETVIKDSFCSDQIWRWTYLLGYLSAITNASETITQNFVTRTLRLIPFIRYLKEKLRYHIDSNPV